MRISGERVSLREFQPHDAAAWQRVAGDPEVTRYSPWMPITSQDEAVAWLREAAWAATQNPRRGYRLAVEEQATGELIGGTALDLLSRTHKQAEIGYYLRQDRWGKGLGTEIAVLMLRLAFDTLDLHRVQATTDPENAASERVLRRVGMRQEGHLRDRYFTGGQWRDRLLFAIIRPEWTDA